MARTKRSRRSYGAGEWGRNRVRVFPDPKTGLYQLEWRENGRRLTRLLKHREWVRAKRQADEFAAGFVGWHSLRRKFASDLMDQPLKVLCELGGWKTAKTVLPCYQRADEGQLRKALEARRLG